MLCAICTGVIRQNEDYHDGNHDEDCPRLKGDWESSCWCPDVAPCHPACCDVCGAETHHRKYPPLDPVRRASRIPFAWVHCGVAPAWADEPPDDVAVIPQAPLAGEEFAAAIAALPIGLMRWAWQKARSLA